MDRRGDLRFRSLNPVYFLFFFSGAAGLVYQVVWSRLLQQIFGVTVYAVTTVLATFLAGLALGALFLGRAADRHVKPLRLYGWLEIGIGLAALAGLGVVRALEPAHIWAANRFAPDSWSLLGVRVLLASIVILPPTFLMGGTLPVVTLVFVGRIAKLGRELGFLYSLNTLGAVVGSLVSGFLLIGLAGLHGTLGIAVIANLVVGGIALGLGRAPAGRGAAQASGAARAGRQPPVSPGRAEAAGVPPTQGVPPAQVVPRAQGIGILAVMALSGFASLGLEVVWTRMLVLVVGTTTYAFVTMLATFLVGIALGSWLARLVVDRLERPRLVFGWIQIGIAASTLATLPLMRQIAGPGQIWHEASGNWLTLIAIRFGLSFLVMLVPTTLIGMTFPLAGKMWARDMASLGGEVGQVYGANTFGNIVGAAVTGFVLVPVLGLQQSVAALCALSLVAAAWGLVPFATGGRRRARMLGAIPVVGGLAVATIVAILALLWRPPPFRFQDEEEGDPVLYYREGLVSTVKVVQRARDGRQRWMGVDGTKIGESSVGVDRKQQVLAHFPFLLEPGGGPQRIVSIGLGTGILIGEVAKHPEVRAIDCLEISPAVIEASALFRTHNHGVLDDPRVRVICDDGINFLQRTASRYEAVISDAKSRTAHAGNALFFSADYYQLCHDRLEPGGLMIQWVPLDIPLEEVRVVLRTFGRVFSHVYVWVAHNSLFVVGTEEELTLDVEHMQRGLDAEATAGLRRHGWTDAQDVVGFLAADHGSLAAWLGGDGKINTVDRPILEFYSPRAHAAPSSDRIAQNLEALAAVRRGPFDHVVFVHGDSAAALSRHRAAGLLVEALAGIERGDRVGRGRGLGRLEQALAAGEGSDALSYAAGDAYFAVALSLQREGRLDEAVAFYRRTLAVRPEHLEANNNLGSALADQGQMAEAIAYFRRAVELNPEFGGAHANLGAAMTMLGEFGEATLHYREAVRIAPGLAKAHLGLGLALGMAGRVEEARIHLAEAARLKPEWPAPAAAMREIAAVASSDSSLRRRRRSRSGARLMRTGVTEVSHPG